MAEGGQGPGTDGLPPDEDGAAATCPKTMLEGAGKGLTLGSIAGEAFFPSGPKTALRHTAWLPRPVHALASAAAASFPLPAHVSLWERRLRQARAWASLLALQVRVHVRK